MVRPGIEVFQTVAATKGGNLSAIASHFRVQRCTVYEWLKRNLRFKQAIEDARGRMFDECLTTSRIVALGIPETDEDGEMIGWRVRPDGNMLRYLMSTLGRNEGFGECVRVDAEVKMTAKEEPTEEQIMAELAKIESTLKRQE